MLPYPGSLRRPLRVPTVSSISINGLSGSLRYTPLFVPINLSFTVLFDLFRTARVSRRILLRVSDGAPINKLMMGPVFCVYTKNELFCIHQLVSSNLHY